jgi:hypothetical protein
MDVTTAWEEGGAIRVYLNPGHEKSKAPWPAVTVGNVRSPEDAVFADLDGDGVLDVVSSCEGAERTIYVHWAPKDPARLLDTLEWRTEPIPASRNQTMWMFALPMQIDGRRGDDLVVGAKGENAIVGWLEAPADPRDLAGWKLHSIYSAGWVMSLAGHDVDDDGDEDVIVSDRKGKNRGVLWLENPHRVDGRTEQPAEARITGGWREHRIGGDGQEVMFLDLTDIDADRWKDLVCATSNGRFLFLRRSGSAADAWTEHQFDNPFRVPIGKSVRAGDLDLDGRIDLVHTAELRGRKQGPGVTWMSPHKDATNATWDVHDISGSEGDKFDLVQLGDLDGDGDLDVIACEERHNLGVFWYENPLRR